MSEYSTNVNMDDDWVIRDPKQGDIEFAAQRSLSAELGQFKKYQKNQPHGTDIQEPCTYLVPDFDFSQEWIVDE